MTRKGRDTRSRLLAAGRKVLESRGYAASTVGEITELGGVALGTYYRYFDNKDDLCLALLDELFEEHALALRGEWNRQEPMVNLLESSRGYLRSYAHNRKLIAAMLQMAAIVPGCADRWRALRSESFETLARYLARTPVSDVVDVKLAAQALGSMADQFAYTMMVEHTAAVSSAHVERAAETIATLWYRAIYCPS